eukprot:1151034-Pelagomonas_calceolata.AAC.3
MDPHHCMLPAEHDGSTPLCVENTNSLSTELLTAFIREWASLICPKAQAHWLTPLLGSHIQGKPNKLAIKPQPPIC